MSRPDVILLGKKAKPALKRPRKWNVVLLNDDFTPMDLVVQILVMIFGHSREAAVAIMLEVHETGRGLAGTFPHEVAEQKALEAMETAHLLEFPLQAMIEPEA